MMRWIAPRAALAAAGLALAGLAAPAAALSVMGQPGMGDPGTVGPHLRPPLAHPFGPWLLAAGLFLLLRALLLLGLVVLVWRLLGARPLWQRPDPAVQALRERYARGEIGEDEYRTRLGTLG
jgi:hypothetical protein